MIRHKYAIGQEVEFLPGRMDFNVPRGTYRILRHLPIEANTCQYRVKNLRDGHERIMNENQLAVGVESRWSPGKHSR